MKNKRKKTILCAAVTVLALTACGNQKDSGGSASGSPSENGAFVSRFFSLESDYIDYSGIQLSDGNLCYLSLEPDPETGLYVQCLNRRSPEDEPAPVPLIWPEEPENIHLRSYDFDGDGGLWGLAVSYTQDPAGSGDFLCKFDSKGNCVTLLDITARLRKNPEEQTWIGTMKLDREGRIYLQGSEGVWLFDGEGNFQGMLSPDSSESAGSGWIDAMFLSPEGSMYISYSSRNSPVQNHILAELDFEKKSLSTVSEDFPGGKEFAPASEKGLLMHDYNCLSLYEPASGTEEILFNWADCDINGSDVQKFWETENGQILAVISDSRTNGSEIALLTRAEEDQTVKKETLVLAVLRDGYNYQPAVVDFNRNNDKYHITIKEYMDPESDSPTPRADALAKLYADLTSGNCPDLVELTGLNTALLAEKGVFQDLTPYLKESEVLNKEDFVEEIIEAYTFNDKLVCIPSLFFLGTVMGSSDRTGPDAGWTLEDVEALVRAYPGAELFAGAGRRDILNFVLLYYKDAFVDEAAGLCEFDSPAFRSLLEFVNRFPEEPPSVPDRPSTPVRIQKGEVLLNELWLYDFDSIQMDIEMFRGNAVCIGYPSPEGSARHTLTSAFAFALPSGSAHKEGAWTFLESFLVKESTKENTSGQMGFPTVKRRLESMIEAAVTPEYLLDENGEPLLDENGEPILSGTRTTGSGDGWSYTYHTATREEVDMVLSLLEGAVLTEAWYEDEIINIITQEAEACFSGQKTAEAVSEIIQNRVSLYLNENQKK